jgi:hypothetical protein
MEVLELISYLKETEGYIEYSFYKNSSEIMGAVAQKGIDEVLNIISINEIKKGLYDCETTWEIDNENCINKKVNIDISGEMIYITESLENSGNSLIKDQTISEIDIQKEYGEILELLKSKPLNSIEKNILTKVVSAFFK